MWTQAADGEEALIYLAQGREAAVILSDVVMPRLGGIGLVKALRSNGWAMPVVLMSGHTTGRGPAGAEGSRSGGLARQAAEPAAAGAVRWRPRWRER